MERNAGSILPSTINFWACDMILSPLVMKTASYTDFEGLILMLYSDQSLGTLKK